MKLIGSSKQYQSIFMNCLSANCLFTIAHDKSDRMAASYMPTFTHTAAQETFDQNHTAKYHQTSYKLLCFSHKMHLSLLLSLYTNSMSSFAINALFCYKIRFLRSAIKFTYIDQSWVASSMITMILFLAYTITRARISIFATVVLDYL